MHLHFVSGEVGEESQSEIKMRMFALVAVKFSVLMAIFFFTELKTLILCMFTASFF